MRKQLNFAIFFPSFFYEHALWHEETIIWAVPRQNPFSFAYV